MVTTARSRAWPYCDKGYQITVRLISIKYHNWTTVIVQPMCKAYSHFLQNIRSKYLLVILSNDWMRCYPIYMTYLVVIIVVSDAIHDWSSKSRSMGCIILIVVCSSTCDQNQALSKAEPQPESNLFCRKWSQLGIPWRQIYWEFACSSLL